MKGGIRYPKPYYVPRTCRELRESLRQMGVTRIGGMPLSRVRKKQLYAVFFGMRDKTWNGPLEL